MRSSSMRCAPAPSPRSSSGPWSCRTASTLPQVVVPDPLRALQELAAWWRSRHAVRVVGITGSTGKTIAKEIIADVLSLGLVTLRNEGNLNSETGLPMTLLRLRPEHEAAVLEMSMYTVGEIARLAEIARPEVGVVLAVHPTHLERAGSIEPHRAGEGRAARAPCQPTASRCSTPMIRASRPCAGLTRAAVRPSGLARRRTCAPTRSSSRGLAGTEFTLEAPWGDPPAAERHAGAASRAACAGGRGRRRAARRPARRGRRAPSRRAATLRTAWRSVESRSGATLVDDTYNASPVSVAAALEFLAETPLPAGGRRIAVLGDMLELGPDEERLHREIGVRAGEASDAIVAVGERGRWIAEGARRGGAAFVAETDDAADAVALVERELVPGPSDIVLLKASRGIGLDRAVELLAEEAP